jgi:hypothetical protein
LKIEFTGDERFLAVYSDINGNYILRYIESLEENLLIYLRIGDEIDE